MPPRITSTISNDVRVSVTPAYLPEKSSADENRFVFSYHVAVTNLGSETIQLLSRHWVIIDADANRHDVRGPGVVGRTPILEPDESFSYASYCPLGTPWGTMEGEFTFEYKSGSLEGRKFDACITRFYLAAHESPLPAPQSV
ncbi:MAG TPA: Co2+/Mg2+ efflux protein ApaG [Phycisphaerales bacterium]|nr:Co2+/Mg2+ efflux protein ApaG [Phycisphaerales bacterium]